MDLHRIPEPEAFDAQHGALAPELVWFETVEREVGKRTWAQLLIQDYFSYPYKELYSTFHADITIEIDADHRPTCRYQPSTLFHGFPHELQ